MDADPLLAEARKAAGFARAPYSQFPVGAAVETTGGSIYRGCNIESASYGLTICAERVAIFSALANGEQLRRIAVSCTRGDPSLPGTLMPCGACRQVMLDTMDRDAEVLVDAVGSFNVGDLLPEGFRLP